MTKRFPMVLTALALVGAAAAAAQAPDSAKAPMKMMMEDHAGSGWMEMDAFHMVLMKTWHPAKMMQSLQPIREKAGDLAATAGTWSASSFPKPCDDSLTHATVTRIAADAKALAGLVASKGGDEAVMAALKAVHDAFEPIEKGCKPGKPHN